MLCNYNNVKIIILGDFNLPAIKWSLPNDVAVSHKYGNIELDALANFSYLNLKQFNTIKNNKNSILDLILSNALNVVVDCEQYALVPIDYLYHPALLIKFKINYNIKPLHFNETTYDYLSCDYNIIRSSLASTIGIACFIICKLMMRFMCFMILFLRL